MQGKKVEVKVEWRVVQRMEGIVKRATDGG